MPPISYWFSGAAIFLAGSFAFAIIVGLIGIKPLISSATFNILILGAIFFAALAWLTAARQEKDNAELEDSIKKIAGSANVDPNQSAKMLADEIIKKLEPLQKKVEELANPPREDDWMYQDNKPIARVAGITLDQVKMIATFQAVTADRVIDFSKDIELQKMRLRCQSASGNPAVISMGAAQTFTYWNVTCQLLGPR